MTVCGLRRRPCGRARTPGRGNTPSHHLYYTPWWEFVHQLDPQTRCLNYEDWDQRWQVWAGIGWESSELCPCPLPFSLKVRGPGSLCGSGMWGGRKRGEVVSVSKRNSVTDPPVSVPNRDPPAQRCLLFVPMEWNQAWFGSKGKLYGPIRAWTERCEPCAAAQALPVGHGQGSFRRLLEPSVGRGRGEFSRRCAASRYHAQCSARFRRHVEMPCCAQHPSTQPASLRCWAQLAHTRNCGRKRGVHFRWNYTSAKEKKTRLDFITQILFL